MEDTETSFWLNRWEAGKTQFHQDHPHPQLVKHGGLLPQGKVLVPLCGKSLDMLWLHAQGHPVIGIELSPIACEAFFKENELTYTQKHRQGFTIFEGEGVTLWCGDFFQTPREVWQGVRGIYDRAAMVAFSPEYRERYAGEILQRIETHGIEHLSMLLIAFEYPQEKFEGPPFSVPADEIEARYGRAFVIRPLDRHAESSLSQRQPNLTGEAVFESTYLLSR